MLSTDAAGRGGPTALNLTRPERLSRELPAPVDPARGNPARQESAVLNPDIVASAGKLKDADPKLLAHLSQLLQSFNEGVAAQASKLGIAGEQHGTLPTQPNQHLEQCAKVAELQKKLQELLAEKQGATGSAAPPDTPAHAPAQDNNPALPASTRQADSSPAALAERRQAANTQSPGELKKMAGNVRNCFGGRLGTLAMAGVFGAAAIGGLALLFAAPSALVIVALFGLAFTAEMVRPVKEFQADIQDKREEEAKEKAKLEAEAEAAAAAAAEENAEDTDTNDVANQQAVPSPPTAQPAQTVPPTVAPHTAAATLPGTMPARPEPAILPPHRPS